jgi:DNA invertase Pin-like site-specific DNA recombinase
LEILYPSIGKIASKSMIHSKVRISMKNKITTEHLSRQAFVYVRQSTASQVIEHRESQRLQYRLVDRAKELGWSEEKIFVIDSDLGTSATGSVTRVGFQQLLLAVSEGKVGAIFSIDASRLARNGREWHTLLEVCGIMRTILVDQEAIYDLNLSNDRLVLGLKGEMSTMELSLLKERSQAAIQHKASRGELYLSLPAAYIKTRDNRLEKNPDRRIQEVIDLVFTKFRQYGTMRRVYKWFLHAKIEVPAFSNSRGPRTIGWKLPSTNTILKILDNPIYAGAYAYGRTKTEVTFKNGRKRLKKGIRKEQKDWDVLILDHHEGYIEWAEYENNMKTLAENTNKKRPIVRGSVRGGEAMLGGLLRCGHCGGKLSVKYQGRGGNHKRYQCSPKQGSEKEKSCISFGGYRVDRAVIEELFKVLSPIGLEASVKAIEKINDKSKSITRQRELELEEARYEALRAKRQYNAVDPDNRLVAATLEKDWNDALVRVVKLEDNITSLSETVPRLSVEEKAEIRELSQDLSRVWKHPGSSVELKKRIIRTIIKEIVVYLKEDKIRLVIHWEGDEHTELKMLKNKSNQISLKTNVEVKKIITELARIMPDKHIVAFLNRLGKTTAKGHTWNPIRLRAFRSNNNIAVYREGERQERGEFTVDEASAKLGVSKTKVWRLIQHKILQARQVCSGAPWIISKIDLESEAVIKAARTKLPKRPLSQNSKQKMLNFQ